MALQIEAERVALRASYPSSLPSPTPPSISPTRRHLSASLLTLLAPSVSLVQTVADTPSLGAAPVFSAATKSKSKAVAAHDAAYERILAGLTTRERETVRAREKVFKGLLLRDDE